jgi:DNA repair exonuclease SbcCD ATPase subunit
MDDKMIPAQGGLYTPEELASAYAERGERIEELLRLNDRLDARIAELEEVTAAVTVLVNWVNKDKADNADLEDRIDGLETEQHELSSNVEETCDPILIKPSIASAMRQRNWIALSQPGAGVVLAPTHPRKETR